MRSCWIYHRAVTWSLGGLRMKITRAAPHPVLRHIVRSFEERRIDLASTVLSCPAAPRPQQMLAVHLAQPFRVRVNGAPARNVPETVVVGPQTVPRAHLYLSGEIHV